MSVVSSPLRSMRDLVLSESGQDAASQVRRALEQAAITKRVLWNAADPSPAAVSPDGASTGAAAADLGDKDQQAAPAVQKPDPGARHSEEPVTSGVLRPEDATGILLRGPRSTEERQLLAQLFAVAVKRDWPQPRASQVALVRRMSWLVLWTRIDPFPWLEEALGPDERGELWSATAELILVERRPSDEGQLLEVFSAAWQLAQARSPEGRRAASEAAARSGDEWIGSIVASGKGVLALSGELAPTPRGPIATTLMALTFVLFISRFVRLAGRWALAYRRPTRLRLGPEGLEMEQRTEMLGRVLRERRVLFSLDALARITRETRFANLGLYVGLLALVIGTFIGSGLLVDGVQVSGGSTPLIALGLLFVLLGVGADAAIALFDGRRRQHCRLVVEPRNGRALCIARVDLQAADAVLEGVKAQLARAAVAAPKLG